MIGKYYKTSDSYILNILESGEYPDILEKALSASPHFYLQHYHGNNFGWAWDNHPIKNTDIIKKYSEYKDHF